MNKNYFISKDNKNGEVVYLEYNKNGYNVKPKVKKEDAIEVSKIVFVSPTLTEKLIKKKINKAKLTFSAKGDSSPGTHGPKASVITTRLYSHACRTCIYANHMIAFERPRRKKPPRNAVRASGAAWRQRSNAVPTSKCSVASGKRELEIA